MTTNARRKNDEQFDTTILQFAANIANEVTEQIAHEVQDEFQHTSGDVAAQYWTGENFNELVGMIARYIACERDMGE
jgi:hypothetical protein